MKFSFAFVLFIFLLSGCNIHKIHEKTAQDQAEKEGLVAISKPEFDASFILPGASLGQYKKIILNDLDFSRVKIIKPSSSHSFQELWELTEKDKEFYQKKFTDSAKNYLFEKGDFSAAISPASDTLVLKTKITEIAPLASKDDFKSRPNLMDVYSEGFGRMTIVFELYDSVSNKLIVLSSDEHDLGRIWERNDRAQNNMQLKLAFDYWLKNLNDELRSNGNK
ncbi:MAG: DUF3313 family protein [Gammaproteobacteria bacterium]|nr:MAG: DUF3313 family protein [Gammaproteobacteria bacterium]